MYGLIFQRLATAIFEVIFPHIKLGDNIDRRGIKRIRARIVDIMHRLLFAYTSEAGVKKRRIQFKRN